MAGKIRCSAKHRFLLFLKNLSKFTTLGKITGFVQRRSTNICRFTTVRLARNGWTWTARYTYLRMPRRASGSALSADRQTLKDFIIVKVLFRISQQLIIVKIGNKITKSDWVILVTRRNSLHYCYDVLYQCWFASEEARIYYNNFNSSNAVLCSYLIPTYTVRLAIRNAAEMEQNGCFSLSLLRNVVLSLKRTSTKSFQIQLVTKYDTNDA